MKRFAHQLAWQWGAAVAVGVGTLAMQAALAQSLGASNFAILSVTLTLAMIFYVVQNGGYRTLLLRESVHPTPGFPSADTLYGQAAGHIFTTTLALLAIAVAVGLTWQSTMAWLTGLAIAANAPRILANLMSAKLLSRGDLVIESQWQMLSRLIPFVVAACAATFGVGVAGILVTLLVCQIGVLHWHPSDIALPSMAFRIHPAVRATSLHLLALEIFGQLYLRQGTLILSVFAPLEDVGRYALMLRFVEAFSMLMTPLGILFHNQVRSSGLNASNTRALAAGILSGAALALVCAYGVQYVAGGEILSRIFGPEFRAASALAPALLLGAALSVPNVLLGQSLIALADEGGFMRISALLAAINLVLSVVLINIYGVQGAAVAMALTEAALLIMLVRRIRRTKQELGLSADPIGGLPF